MTAQKEAPHYFPDWEEVPGAIRLKQPVHQRVVLINGKLIPWDGPVHTVTSPIYIHNLHTGEDSPLEIGSYPLGTVKEAFEALQAAMEAFDHGRGKWPSMTMQQRIECIRLFVRSMERSREEVVRLIMWEIGKTTGDAEKEFDRTIEYIRETIKAAGRLHNRNVELMTANDFIGQTKKVPLGVVLCMGPFNYPLNETFTTLIPALVMGNTVLFKPPKHGTLLFAPLLQAFADAFPKGVVNTVYGRGKDVIPALMKSGKIDVLALIGSSKVADDLKKMHPRSNRLKAVLGLDAKNAAIILPDADLKLAVKECLAGALSFNGQRCTALKIFFVHASVIDEFNSLLTAEVNRLVAGMPWQKEVSITPLAEPGKPVYLKELIGDALGKGSRIINRAPEERIDYLSLVKPVVLYPVNNNMRVYHEEQFGPVIPVVPFEQMQTPVSYITDSPYGQQVSIFGEDSQTIALLIDMLNGQVGRININTQCQRSPDSFAFGGRKDSAEGTLSIEEALLTFSTDSVVAARQFSKGQQIFEKILMNNQSRRLTSQITHV